MTTAGDHDAVRRARIILTGTSAHTKPSAIQSPRNQMRIIGTATDDRPRHSETPCRCPRLNVPAVSWAQLCKKQRHLHGCRVRPRGSDWPKLRLARGT